MCGIAVAIRWDEAERLVGQLMVGLTHRGDTTDHLISPLSSTAMCTRRLRIVDGDNAIQPQASFDSRILVAFNGEIYNHHALRRELESLKVKFKTASDTEVLASALSVWGTGALDRINGMYAFVALNVQNGSFMAARDPLGIKPLYLMQSETGFLFCSEMRPLLSAIPDGPVHLLPPGYRLTQTALTQFRSLQVDPMTANAWSDPVALDKLVAEAVHIRMPEDIPAAIMFSGGIDSTLIAHYARQRQPETPGYFLGDARSPDYEFAAGYADATGFDMRCVDVQSPDTIANQIDEIIQTVESFEPGVVRDSFCTYLLSKRIHDDGFKVVLSGEGADELFAGYETLEIAFAQGILPGIFVRNQHLGSMHCTNLQRLDRCSMHFQLEARVPFLDTAIEDHALILGASALVRCSGSKPMGKMPLRRLYDLHPHVLPRSIRDRIKVPIGEGSGFEGGRDDSPWRTFAEETISDSDLANGKLRFAAFNIWSKEELLYLAKLDLVLDVSRIPHLTRRARLLLPNSQA